MTDHPVATARCGYCGEHYDLGQTVVRGGDGTTTDPSAWVWYPNGEAAYWTHTRDSQLHQQLRARQHAFNNHLLNRVESEWNALRQMSKDYRDPARHALTRVLS